MIIVVVSGIPEEVTDEVLTSLTERINIWRCWTVDISSEPIPVVYFRGCQQLGTCRQISTELIECSLDNLDSNALVEFEYAVHHCLLRFALSLKCVRSTSTFSEGLGSWGLMVSNLDTIRCKSCYGHGCESCEGTGMTNGRKVWGRQYRATPFNPIGT